MGGAVERMKALIDMTCFSRAAGLFLSKHVIMTRMHGPLGPLVFCLLTAVPAFAQEEPKHPDTAMLHFFEGRWTGEGAFANGNKIAADLSFTLSLDSCWLVYEHRDRPPHRYKATSMWGLDGQTGEFVAYCFDNFQGHREFEGNGWKEGKLVLTHHGVIPKVGLYFEHFIYERTGERSFKMTYETSRDGITWVMGDWLAFKKLEG